MTENQQPYEIKVGQHGKNCECSKCQPVKTTFCECETRQAHRAGKQESTKDRLKRFLAEAKAQDGELRCEDGSVFHPKARGCHNCANAKIWEGCSLGKGETHLCLLRDKRAYWVKKGDDTIKKNDHDADEMVRGKALKKALEVINGERQDSYGNPEDSFALIAKYWNAYLIEIQKAVLVRHGFDPAEYSLVDMLDGRHVAEMMALFKIARMSGQKATPDNYVDCAGYIGIAGDMV